MIFQGGSENMKGLPGEFHGRFGGVLGNHKAFMEVSRQILALFYRVPGRFKKFQRYFRDVFGGLKGFQGLLRTSQ